MTDETQTGQPAQGWYPDPNDASRLRWWDGTAWTDHTHGGEGAGVEQAQPAAQAQTAAAQAAPAAASTTGPGGIVSNPAPAAGAAGSRRAPSAEKGAVGQWLSVRSNQVLLLILILAVALFVFVMVGGAA